ncbi:MAG TPA: DUF6262 family protein [Candidatus Sulfotelmatobacter sp.]|jgi:hypothetical protein|nr:DUF6262 family protein [Candidatus Sulfotelmatobacter sp.]
MHRNIDGLKRSARLRSDNAITRAAAALHRMEATNKVINFRTVAAEAQVSTAWLYKQQQLRVHIMRWRKLRGSPQVLSLPRQESERISRRNIVTTLRFRIKQLEARNRELTELLEHARGVIAHTLVSDCKIGST